MSCVLHTRCFNYNVRFNNFDKRVDDQCTSYVTFHHHWLTSDCVSRSFKWPIAARLSQIHYFLPDFKQSLIRVKIVQAKFLNHCKVARSIKSPSVVVHSLLCIYLRSLNGSAEWQKLLVIVSCTEPTRSNLAHVIVACLIDQRYFRSYREDSWFL
ncbi:unnamed protein product [Albugo candida]|uniref:Uncharacterized protein n=1 Tax=Albugo candida TaxID=65357 RepID=A0A024GL96_9STRA|nr:unnamed protein product [Albugo candida]|eukprot:CCI47295.1 unnamed protein product [Albugo candida]